MPDKHRYQRNKAWYNAYGKEYRRLNREKERRRCANYHRANAERLNEYTSRWKLKNRERVREYQRQWCKKNRARLSEKRRLRLAGSPSLRIQSSMSARIYVLLRGKGSSKNFRRTIEILGCTPDFFRDYIAARFQEGMSWENYGNGRKKWSVDHRIPCAAFDLNDSDEQRQCFHYSNLQPMWFRDNARKRAEMPPQHQAELL